MSTDPDGRATDASRRTLLAQERTYLAWFRSAITALAVSVGVGRLIPAVVGADRTGFLMLGTGYAILGFILFVYGLVRHRRVEEALERGGFVPLPMPAVIGLTLFGVALTLATFVVLLW
ncbi:MAG: DUF202 domain-containing protein [Actinomycetota bacterium]|nr:DUF202 domain-containing protein [Actinomycetota bacterium]